MSDAPVRLCCMQRHFDTVCPDGKVMCCLCFDRFDQDDLHTLPNGKREDVCRECGITEELDARLDDQENRL